MIGLAFALLAVLFHAMANVQIQLGNKNGTVLSAIWMVVCLVVSIKQVFA